MTMPMGIVELTQMACSETGLPLWVVNDSVRRNWPGRREFTPTQGALLVCLLKKQGDGGGDSQADGHKEPEGHGGGVKVSLFGRVAIWIEEQRAGWREKDAWLVDFGGTPLQEFEGVTGEERNHVRVVRFCRGSSYAFAHHFGQEPTPSPWYSQALVHEDMRFEDACKVIENAVEQVVRAL